MKLKFGGQELDLKKSEKYIAVKAVPQREQLLARGLEEAPELLPDGRKMAGFTLVATPDDVEAGSKLDELRLRSDVEAGTHVYEVEGDEENGLIPTGDLYIVFREGSKHADCKALLEQSYLKIKEVRGKREIIVTCTPLSPNPVKVAMLLQEREDLIDICEPNFAAKPKICALSSLPMDQLFPAQWHLQNTGNNPNLLGAGELKAGADAKVVDAWNELSSLGSSGIVIAVPDPGGCNINHPDFEGKVVFPYDFEFNSNETLLLEGDSQHGTKAAGVACAMSNGSGAVGAAPNAKVMPVRFVEFDDDLLEAMFRHFSDNGADIVSCSWGKAYYTLSTRAQAAIRKCATTGRKGRGCIIVFAAGNETTEQTIVPVSGFAAHPDVICVGATSSLDEYAFYSNQGPQVWVSAPSNGDRGVPIVTTGPGHMAAEQGTDLGEIDDLHYAIDFGGTSSATPLVAGVCALILSANPNLSAAQVKQILAQTADKVGPPSEYDAKGHSHKYGYGRINAVRAVRLARTMTGQSATEPTPVVTNLPLRAVVKGNLPTVNSSKMYQITYGTHLILQAKPMTGNADIEVFLRKASLPIVNKEAFDKRSVVQNGVNVIVEAEATTSDYFIAVKANSGLGAYGLQITLSGQGRIVPPGEAQAVGGVNMLRLQNFIQQNIAEGQTHYYRVTLGERLTMELAAVEDGTRDFDLYYRKNALPIPSGRQYDDSSSDVDTSKEKISLDGTAILQADYFFLVRSVKGDGNFMLTVQTG